MSRAHTIIDRVRYADGSTGKNDRRLGSTGEARRECARMIRQIRAAARTDFDLVLCHGSPGSGAFMVTNAQGPERFVRDIKAPAKPGRIS